MTSTYQLEVHGLLRGAAGVRTLSKAMEAAAVEMTTIFPEPSQSSVLVPKDMTLQQVSSGQGAVGTMSYSWIVL